MEHPRENAFRACFLLFIALAFLPSIVRANSTISISDINQIKFYADVFNASRNASTPNGPAEYECWTSGTFLAYHYCYDIPTCTETANLICSTSGQGACETDVLAADILEYKNDVDHLNAAYEQFMVGYNSFSSSNIPGTLPGALNQMDAAFDAMKLAADQTGQSKMRLPDQIPCPCSGGADCCIGRCPEARFNYTAISDGQAEIASVRTKSCSDGTPSGQCSSTKPLECDFGSLVSNSGRCGCPTGTLPNGSSCQTLPGSCLEGNVSIPNNVCSNNTRGKMCQNGVWVDAAVQCGCASPQVASGEQCVCPSVTTQVCNTTDVTKSHNVTYIFDRGMQKTVEESYTFPRTICYNAQNAYNGTNCSQLVSTTIDPSPINQTPEPVVDNFKTVACDRCPAICTRNPPAGLSCGSCACPLNLGFCDANATANRTVVNDTPAYCANELLQAQKPDKAFCSHGYECAAGECKTGLCYNRQKDYVQLFIDWFKKLFGQPIETYQT